MSAYYNPVRFQAIKGLSWATTIGLGLLAISYVADCVIGIAGVADPLAAFGLDSRGDGSFWKLVELGAVALRGPVFLLTAIIFLVWLSRAQRNLVPLRGRHGEFDGGWAVGWWFIPIASLFKPFQVVREVWVESDPDFDPNSGFLPRTGGGAPAFMGFWWFFWITSSIFFNITWRVFTSEMRHLELVIAGLFGVTGFLSFCAAVLAIAVVRSITNRQEQRLTALASHPLLSPTPPPGYGPPPPPVFRGQA